MAYIPEMLIYSFTSFKDGFDTAHYIKHFCHVENSMRNFGVLGAPPLGVWPIETISGPDVLSCLIYGSAAISTRVEMLTEKLAPFGTLARGDGGPKFNHFYVSPL